MKEKAPRPEGRSQRFETIETDKHNPETIKTPYGDFSFVCHKGPEPGRAEQQDAFIAVVDKDKVGLAAIDGITLNQDRQTGRGKEASLVLATEIKKSFLSGTLAGIHERGQAAMQRFGLKEGGAVFAALELPAQVITWVGDARVVVIYPDNTPPLTTKDEVDPKKRNRLRGQIGADYSTRPQTLKIDPPLMPGCIVVVLSDGAYKNLDIPVEFIRDNAPDVSQDDDTALEDPEEIHDAKVLATLLKNYATPVEAVRALDTQIAKNRYAIDNVTLAVLYVDKKIPLEHNVQEG